MTGNHTHVRNADGSILTAVPDVPAWRERVGLPTLPEALTGRLDAQAALFATRMRQGLLAALVAIGLEVLDGLFEAEVTGSGRPEGQA